jgi:hypothetical protein
MSSQASNCSRPCPSSVWPARAQPRRRRPAQAGKPARLSSNFAARRMPEMSDPDETNFVKF